MARKTFTGTSQYPQARQLIGGILYDIHFMCKDQRLICIKSRMTKFLRMTPKDASNASSYLDTFVSSRAPEALVKLYKVRAYDFIRYFITSSKDELDIGIYHALLAPIVLRLCKLLSTAVTDHDDYLYIFCRTSLGSMLEYHKKTTKAVIDVQDIFPFVDELATRLSKGLVSSTRSILIILNYFLRFMMSEVTNAMDFDTLVPKHYYHNHPWYDHHRLGYLYSLYRHLLAKLETCLTTMEDNIVVIRKGKRSGEWDQYLPILSQLYCISQLYEGAEETFWTNLRPHKVAFCYLIVRFAKRDDKDCTWILDHEDYLTDFESRTHLLMMLLPEVTQNKKNGHKMLINRSSLLAESFQSIKRANLDRLRGQISMRFTNEEAYGPGVLREWFILVCEAIFNPQYALFLACPTDPRRFFPNPASNVNKLHLKYYRFAGRLIALALMHKMQVGISFSRAFFLQLAGIKISLEDIKDADPYLHNSCKQILEMDPCVVDQDVLGLTFTWGVEELGVKKVVELLPHGELIGVNSKNRKQYIDLVIKHQFVTSISQQVSNFSQGFLDIVTYKENMELCFKILKLENLDGMLRGSESDISVDDWKAHTQYKGYKKNDFQIYWFWKIVREMSAEQRKLLLFFWTSLKYLPVEGFHGLASRLYIIKSDETYDHLPSSHTCFYEICIPAYPSTAVMQKRLNIITQDYVGCSFGTA